MPNNDDDPDALTGSVIGAAMEVANTLGSGFLEKVYERALTEELRLRNIQATPQVSFPVSYKGHIVGTYSADIVIGNELLVEVKCADRIANEHIAQCLNYLRASGLPLCLLINFHKSRLEWRRLIGPQNP